MGPPSPYAKPTVRSAIKSSLVRSIGGIQSGVPSKVFAQKKRLGSIRFVSSTKEPIKQKGIPRAKRKQLVGITLGTRTYISGKRFIQRGKNGRLHVFRSKETTRKWVMIRNTVASVYSVLSHEKPQGRMEAEARRVFSQTLQSYL